MRQPLLNKKQQTLFKSVYVQSDKYSIYDLADMFNLSENQVMMQAKTLKVRRRKTMIWSDEEKDQLRLIYSVMHVDDVAHIMKRPKLGISQMAHKLKLRQPKNLKRIIV